MVAPLVKAFLSCAGLILVTVLAPVVISDEVAKLTEIVATAI
jgi:hypothetical protein